MGIAVKNIHLLILSLIIFSCGTSSKLECAARSITYRRTGKKLSKPQLAALQAAENTFNAAEAELKKQTAAYCAELEIKGAITLRTQSLLKKAFTSIEAAQAALPAESFYKWDNAEITRRNYIFTSKINHAQEVFDLSPAGRAISAAVRLLLDAAEALDLGEAAK